MPTFASDQGLVVNIGLVSSRQDYESVFPIIGDAPLPPFDSIDDIRTWFVGTLFPLWQAILAEDCYINHIKVNNMVAGKTYSTRTIYSPLDFPGLVAGESSPTNASVLAVFYADDQPDATHRVRTAKNFLGPPPESAVHGDTLTAAYAGTDVQALITAIATGLLGAHGVNYYRALRRDFRTGQPIYACTRGTSRFTVFTQRRRLKPIL